MIVKIINKYQFLKEETSQEHDAFVKEVLHVSQLDPPTTIKLIKNFWNSIPEKLELTYNQINSVLQEILESMNLEYSLRDIDNLTNTFQSYLDKVI